MLSSGGINMSRDFPVKKSSRYEELLRQATKYPALETFCTPQGLKGIYRLDGNRTRTFLVAEVQRKEQELREQLSEESER